MNFIDIAIQNYFSISRTLGLTEFMYIVSIFFDVSVYSATIFICFVILVYLFRGIRYSIFFSTTVLFTGFLVYLLKVFFNTARPLGGVVSAFGPSFPSYHAAMSTIFFITTFYVLNMPTVSSGLYQIVRKIELAFVFILVFLVSSSRVYLGVHWFSDVVFGIFLGIAIFYFSKFLFQRNGWL